LNSYPAADGGDSGHGRDVRRVNPQTGEVLVRLEMPPGVSVSTLESDGSDQFFLREIDDCDGLRIYKTSLIDNEDWKNAVA
jgi:hypothetical protein